MARFSNGEYDEKERNDYLEEYFSNHIDDYIVQELESEHDSGNDLFNHSAEFLNDEKDNDDNYWGYLDDLIDEIASSFNLNSERDLETIRKIAAISFDPCAAGNDCEQTLDDLKDKLDGIQSGLFKSFKKELKYRADESFWNSENDDIWKEHVYQLQQSYYTASNLIADLIEDFLHILKIDYEDNYSHSWNPGDFESRYISCQNKDGDELTVRLCDGHDNGTFYDDFENKEINIFDLLNQKISLSDIIADIKDLLIDDFENFPNFDFSNKNQQLKDIISDFENID